MKLNYYRWPIEHREMTDGNEVRVISVDPFGANDPRGYVPHPELVEAVNVALALGMPLLLTGEPGTGKTTLAASVAFQLGYRDPVKFVAKSNSVSRDLFYTYDALGRLYAAEIARIADSSPEERKRADDPLNFIEYAALGQAILLAHRDDRIKRFIVTNDGHVRLHHAGKPQRSVVLIDEIDKAPRDFTNDLLDELETMQFRVPELHDAVTPPLQDRNMRPIVIITSNSERQLPDAFLRRCLYFHIPFPDRDHAQPDGDAPAYSIENIVAERLGPRYGSPFTRSQLVTQALEFFYRMRDMEPRLRKPPATAELLNWLVAMREDGANGGVALRDQPTYALRTIATLSKNLEDQQRCRLALDEWLRR
jgi:MoxR-like ATPase